LAKIDPDVSRLKFDREINRLVEQRSTLQSRGIFLVGAPTYPIVEFLFVPRHSLQVVLQAKQSGSIILPEGAVVAVKLPSLAARSFKAHFDLTDYDLQPPSLEFRDSLTDGILVYDAMFRALEYEKERKAHVVLLPDHPITHKPFLCLRGIREYHEHPQHSGDDWLLYREQISLFSIVMSVWRVTIDLIHPILMPRPDGLQVQWQTEEKL
jgi:hypothetical protein